MNYGLKTIRSLDASSRIETEESDIKRVLIVDESYFLVT